MRLDNRIPISNSMGFEVEFFPPSRIEIHAPLNLNVNDKGNAFAGSIYSSLVLAPWYLLTEITQKQGIDCKISVYHSTAEFRTPVEEDFTSHCEISDYGRLISELRGRGRCRVSANAYIGGDEGNQACVFEGKYFLKAI